MHEVTLQVETRPVRLAVLVETRHHVLQAAELFTHVPGGIAGGLVALPTEPTDATEFRELLTILDPDVLLLPANLALSPEVSALLNRLPIESQRLRDSDIRQHVAGPNLLHLRSG